MAAVTLRAPTIGDAEEIARVLNAHALASSGDATDTAAGVVEWFDYADLDPEQDMRVAVDASSRITGYADIADDGGLGTVFLIDVRADPDQPDSSGELLDAMEARARAQARPGAVARLFIGEHEEAFRALATERGYGVVRSSYRMLIELDPAPPVAEWPAGITLRRYRAVDEDRVYEAHMEAFTGQWGFTRVPQERWRSWNLGAQSDPSLWGIAWDGDEVAGVCINRPERGEGVGWVGVLAVREPWRRRGLGRALLLDAFATFGAAGRQRAGLGVDAENVTGAVRLYESVGMTAASRSDTWERVL